MHAHKISTARPQTIPRCARSARVCLRAVEPARTHRDTTPRTDTCVTSRLISCVSRRRGVKCPLRLPHPSRHSPLFRAPCTRFHTLSFSLSVFLSYIYIYAMQGSTIPLPLLSTRYTVHPHSVSLVGRRADPVGLFFLFLSLFFFYLCPSFLISIVRKPQAIRAQFIVPRCGYVDVVRAVGTLLLEN